MRSARRTNECFGGKGYRSYVCGRCRKLPKIEQQRHLLSDEVMGFLQQSNISAKNIPRLQEIEACEIPMVARLAGVVRKIAIVKPHKRKRWGFLRLHHQDVYQQAIDAHLIEPEVFEDAAEDESFYDEYSSFD